MSKKNIAKYDKQDINNVGVVSLAIRPNQPSQYGVGSLTGKQLQERFDKLATTAIDKINAVIDVLNSKGVAEYLSLGEAFGEDKSIKDMIADIYSAADGLVTTDPETLDKKAVADILQDFYDVITKLEAFTEIDNLGDAQKLSDVYATKGALSTAIDTHNSAMGTHTDIRDSIPAAIDTHNSAMGTHTDIRDSIPAAISTHNTSTQAHAELFQQIREEFNGGVVGDLQKHNDSAEAHPYIRQSLQDFKDTVNTLLNSDDVDLDQTKEIVAYIKSNKGLIDAITTSKVNVDDIIDNLTTNEPKQALSASQGVALNELITELSQSLSEHKNTYAAKVVELQGNIDDRIKIADIENTLTSTATNKPLSAYKGKELNDRIVNLEKNPAETETAASIKTIQGDTLQFSVSTRAEYEELPEETKSNCFALFTDDAPKSNFRGNDTDFSYSKLEDTDINTLITEGHYFVDKCTPLPDNWEVGLLDVDRYDGEALEVAKQTFRPWKSNAVYTRTYSHAGTSKTWTKWENINRNYNNFVSITGSVDAGSITYDMLFYMNLYSSNAKDYNSVSTFLADMLKFEGVSFTGSGCIQVFPNPLPPKEDEEDEYVPITYNILRMLYYNNELKFEYYDQETGEYKWTPKLNDYIHTTSRSVPM